MICLLRVGLADAEEPEEALLATGADRFGTYRIVRRDDGTLCELGRGAMGVTYRAIDMSLLRPVALKLIDLEWIKRGAEARERFMREARAAAALRHPNVAAVYQFGIQEENGQYFCALELVEGETLEMRVRRTGPLDALTTVEIALQVSSALAAAEKQGLVHRDLKPANLMLVGASPAANGPNPGPAEEVVVKVIDFGVAKALAEKPDAMGLTHGGFVGTPAFASPEQFTNVAVDVRSDIYSLGATLWYLLTGRMPFPGANVEEIRTSHRLHILPIGQLKAARVPNRLSSLLVSMLALEPAVRPGVRVLTSKLRECRAKILDRWKAARRLAPIVALFVVAAAAFLLLPQRYNRAPSQNGPPTSVPRKSIAVLPFANLSQDTENAFFAGGVQDEILMHLAKIADLKVISRTSVMPYKAGPGRNLREIGKQLGVAHLLEGSVQRAANRIRVNAQLIDARTDAHLWAQTYDREIGDVFVIQSEIASHIAEQLQAKISPEERMAIQKPPTTDLAAYAFYVRAKLLLTTPTFTEADKDNKVEAAHLLEQAVARDPSFLLAYCQLAFAHDRLYQIGFDRSSARLASGQRAVENALRLNPDAGEAHLALAWHLYLGFPDYEPARAALAVARQTLPNNPDIFALAGFMDRRQGRQEEGLQNLEQALELDPRNLELISQISISYYHLRRYADEAAMFDRALSIDPKNIYYRLRRAAVDLDARADTKPLHAVIQSILETNPQDAERIADKTVHLALCERDVIGARRALAGVQQEAWGEDSGFPNNLLGEALLARMTNDDVNAQAAFSAARAKQLKVVETQPDFGPAVAVLGLIDAGLHRKEAALQAGRRAVELVPLSRDFGNGGVIMIEYLAMIAAWVDEKDLALEQLAIVTRLPGSLSYGRLRLHPAWDPLRGDPRFEAIVASLAPKEADVPEKSIAVLPFENRSEDGENAFFADAMHDDVLTGLVKIKELKVIGRASVMSYRDGTKRNLKEIGRELAVTHVLEGSVRRVANRMILNVNLTDARDGRAIWAERYDRTIADAIGLQGELATEIASVLRARLGPEEKARLETKQTKNPEAYLLYLKAREREVVIYPTEDAIAADQLYAQAIALDPTFALAAARSSILNSRIYSIGRDPARKVRAVVLAEEALRSSPTLVDAHLAMGLCFYRIDKNYEAALKELTIAAATSPNDPEILGFSGGINYHRGSWREALADFQRAQNLDPRNANFHVAATHYALRDWPAAAAACQRLRQITPENEPLNIEAQIWLAYVEFHRNSDIAASKEILRKIPAGLDPNARVTLARWDFSMLERDYAGAEKILAQFPSEEFPPPMRDPKSYYQACTTLAQGDVALAYNLFEKARSAFELRVRDHPDDAVFLAPLGKLYAYLGLKEDAIRASRRAVELMPENKDAVKGPEYATNLAVVYARTGEVDQALALIERLLSIPAGVSLMELRLHPDWDPLRSNPRFQKILEGPEPKTIY